MVFNMEDPKFVCGGDCMGGEGCFEVGKKNYFLLGAVDRLWTLEGNRPFDMLSGIGEFYPTYNLNIFSIWVIFSVLNSKRTLAGVAAARELDRTSDQSPRKKDLFSLSRLIGKQNKLDTRDAGHRPTNDDSFCSLIKYDVQEDSLKVSSINKLKNSDHLYSYINEFHSQIIETYGKVQCVGLGDI
jgi:hypothetical protein